MLWEIHNTQKVINNKGAITQQMEDIDIYKRFGHADKELLKRWRRKIL